MRAHIAKYWDALWASYWFVPSIMAVAAFLLSLATTVIDARLVEAEVGPIGWLSLNTPDGARALLSTIAGSMITVAGVTFSITIAAVAYATSQLGPHLLGKFMRDRGNQITLGTFIATFIYCLLILRTVQGDALDSPFVPHCGVLVALILALSSIGVLIYFIHHVPRSIHASEVVAQIGAELESRVSSLFPSGFDQPPASSNDVIAGEAMTSPSSMIVMAVEHGYVTHIDLQWLIDLAKNEDSVVRVARGPGDFVFNGAKLAILEYTEELSDDAKDKVRMAFAMNSERTPAQDVPFLVQQLIEIAARALSPGVNDPYTAMGCLDWLGNALTSLGRQSMPSGHLFDDGGRLRVVVPSYSFENFASLVCDNLRPYFSADRNAAIHMIKVLEQILAAVDHPPYRATLLDHVEALKHAVDEALPHPRDLAAFESVYKRIVDTQR